MPQMKALPDDVLRLILTFTAFSFKELVVLLLVSKDFHSVGKSLIKEQLQPFKRQLIEYGIDLADPLFTGFAVQRLPFWRPLDAETCLSAKAEHFSELIGSKSVSAERLDRLFGHMIEFKEVFYKLTIPPQAPLFFDRECQVLSPLRNSLIKFAIDNITTDKYVYKFLYLCLDGRTFFNGITHGIDYYYSRRVKLRERLDPFQSSWQMTNRLWPLPYYFRFSQEFTERLNKLYFLVNISLLLDFMIFFVAIIWCYYASHELQGQFAVDYMMPLTPAICLAIYLENYITPTWPLFYRIDLALNSNVEARARFNNIILAVSKPFYDFGNWILRRSPTKRRIQTQMQALNDIEQQLQTNLDTLDQNFEARSAGINQHFEQIEQVHQFRDLEAQLHPENQPSSLRHRNIRIQNQ